MTKLNKSIRKKLKDNDITIQEVSDHVSLLVPVHIDTPIVSNIATCEKEALNIIDESKLIEHLLSGGLEHDELLNVIRW